MGFEYTELKEARTFRNLNPGSVMIKIKTGWIVLIKA